MTNIPIISFEEFESLNPAQMYELLVTTGEELRCADEKLQYANYINAKLRHELYGRKSEKSTMIQPHPTLPGLDQVFDEAMSEAEDETEETVGGQKKKKKTGRKPLPAHLPRQQIIYDIEDKQCACCGHALHKIGEEVSEQLDFIPAQVKVIQHVRYKYSCKACEEGVITAPAPALPIPKSIATANLLAQVFVSKFDDHLPLYRQAEIWQRLGIDLNRATLSNWVIKAGELCQPLVDLLKQHIVTSSYVQADETTVTYLKTSKRRQKSYMWIYKTGYDDKISLVYDFQESREGKHATSFLEDFTGYLQGDAYGGYNEITSKAGVVRVGCMAHARRKFVDIVKIAPKKLGLAYQAVEKIKTLYKIEQVIKEKEMPPDEIKQYREKHAKPLLDNFKKWLDEIKPKAPPKSPLGQAIAYALNNWGHLIRYLEDGRLDIDNNAAERAVKPFAVGRKNWLFIGNHAGAQGSSVLYSLIETAKANGIDSYQYLRHVLDQIPKLNPDQLHQLLPWNCPSYLQNTFKQVA